ncbi:type II secretion system protein [Kineosporiaceae bacterium SCSIO 59966]|nr:type II secretion system protein [Kineosporiaceae bacterium SCSIO 59966]
MMILGTAIAVVLLSVQNSTRQAEERARINDHVRLAVQHIDRHVRSGNVLYDPAAEETPGFSLRVYSQSNGLQKCMQWRVVDGRLESRSWAPTWQSDHNVSEWSTVASGLVNTPSDPPFSLNPDIHYGGRLVEINLAVGTQLPGARDVIIASSISGRNTQFGYTANVCEPVPAT